MKIIVSARPDLMVKYPNAVFDYIDVSIINPSAPSYQRQNALNARFKAKTRQYQKTLTVPQAEHLIPFILETSGHIHSKAEEYINKIAKYEPGSRPTTGRGNAFTQFEEKIFTRNECCHSDR